VKKKMNKTATMLICLAVVSAALSRPSHARAAVTDQDKQFLAMAAQSDFDEIKLSRLAEGKGPPTEGFSFCAVGPGFRGCSKKSVLLKGTASQAAEKVSILLFGRERRALALRKIQQIQGL
jgi:hypothetical protein